MTPRALVVLLLLLLPAGAHAAANDPDTLSFELPSHGWFIGWGGGPNETQFVDSTVVHSGRYAARLERDQSSPLSESTALNSARVTFSGRKIELRGWLKTRDVDGFVGLWMREDSKDQFNLQMHNMMRVSGTNDWKEYRIELPLDPRADSIWFGAHIVGTGTVWVDDLQFFVDGKPLAEAPVLVRVEDAVQKDHEFDGGSRIAISALSRNQVDNLALLGKVWGFLKYHHPRVTVGEINWDYELFRILPEVLEAKNSQQTQGALAAWVERVGIPAPCLSCATPPDSIALPPNIGWITSRKQLGTRLAQDLQKTYQNRSSAPSQYFVTISSYGSLQFPHERPYRTGDCPDAGYRLLSVFRFWNVVEYWSPYRDLVDGSWDRVLTEFIPRAALASDMKAYATTMMSMVARLGDGHAAMQNASTLRPPGGECAVPVVLRPVDGKCLVNACVDPTDSASGLMIGDVIKSIDGRAVGNIMHDLSPYYAASNEASRNRTMLMSITNGSCGACDVVVERSGKTVALHSARVPFEQMVGRNGGTHDLPGPAFQLLSKDVAYLKLSGVKQSECQSYIEQAAGTKCFLIDIRNYPAEFVPFVLGGHFVTAPAIFTRFTNADLTNPGAFSWKGSATISPLSPHYDGKLAVLVDESTLSQAEYTAMALRAAGAVIVGSQTAGADGNVAPFALPGGLQTAISSIGIFYPDRSPTQRVGIKPDLVVHPTIKGIRDGHDEVAEAAVKHLIGVDLRIPSR